MKWQLMGVEEVIRYVLVWEVLSVLECCWSVLSQSIRVESTERRGIERSVRERKEGGGECIREGVIEGRRDKGKEGVIVKGGREGV